ncbi:MAG: SgcJ/EcaC family oxidoreductase [Gemmatimonadaceae bacterium]
MTATSRTIVGNLGARFSVATPLILALLIGACDRTSPSEVERTASAKSSQSLVPEASSGLRPFNAADVAGVTAVITAWDAAWNAGDANGIAATFVEDAEFINGRGKLAIGAAAIRANHAASLGGVFRGSHTHGTIRRIVFLNDGNAVVDVDNDLTNYTSLPPGTVPTTPGVQSGRHKRVVVKRNGTWRVVLMQITSIAPAPPAT